MNPKLRTAALILFTSLAVTPLSSATFTFAGTLSGANEVPPNASPGTGRVSVVYDDVANTLAIDGFFSGLLGNTTMAHIHVAPPGSNGPVATTTPSLAGFPLGVQSGSFSTLLDLNSATSYRAGFVTDNGGVAGARTALLANLFANSTYFNVHTAQIPAGELRANLVQAPEPGTWLMMLLGFGAVGMVIRRARPQLAAA
jgi:hypothetical protein